MRQVVVYIHEKYTAYVINDIYNIQNSITAHISLLPHGYIQLSSLIELLGFKQGDIELPPFDKAFCSRRI